MLAPILAITMMPAGGSPVGLELFPSGDLEPGEQVLYACRPSFLKRYWGRTLLLVLVFLIFVAPIATAGPSYASDPAVWFFLALAVIFLFVVYSQWSHALYALTNQRLLRVSGWRGGDVESVPVSNVMTVTPTSSSGGSLEFRYSVPTTPTRMDPSGYRVKTMTWPAIPDSLGVSGQVDRALRGAQQALRVESGQMRAEEEVAARTVECPYCGTRSPLSALDAGHPVCPSCSAPLTLPDLPPRVG
jgi:hypothetical protein